MVYRRGDIYYANLSPVVGSEQGGVRPVLVIQNNSGNRFSPTLIVAAITSQLNKSKIPTHVTVDNPQNHGLSKDSIILLEQIRTIDKLRMKNYIGQINRKTQRQVNRALKISLNLSA